MQKVDSEIRRIIDEQYALAERLLKENADKVEAMTKALLEWETVDSDQIKDIMAGREPRPPKPSSMPPLKPKSGSDGGNAAESGNVKPEATTTPVEGAQ